MSDATARTVENDEKFDTINVDEGQIQAYADSAADAGVDTTVTSAGHRITQEMVDNNWSVTISGSTAAQYDGLKVVTRIIDADNFDIAHVFASDPGDGAFLVEKIYEMQALSLAVVRVIKPDTGDVYTSYQKLDPKNLQSSGIKWGDSLSSDASQFDAGENHFIQGIKVTGNPTVTQTEIVIVEVKPRP